MVVKILSDQYDLVEQRMLKRKVATYHVKSFDQRWEKKRWGGINYVAEKVKFLNNYVAEVNYVAEEVFRSIC